MSKRSKKTLDDYRSAMDGTFGCLADYERKISQRFDPESEGLNYAYLSGHFQMLLDEALKEIKAVEDFKEQLEKMGYTKKGDC